VLTVLASDYPFLDIFWTMMIFFFWVIWIWLLILVLSDNFRRRLETSR
jgi:threonine/homoserine/homoserine lactone efflux protein